MSSHPSSHDADPQTSNSSTPGPGTGSGVPGTTSEGPATGPGDGTGTGSAEPYRSPPAGEPIPMPTSPGSPPSDQSTGEKTKEQGKQVAQDAKQSAAQVAQDAKEGGQQVAGTAVDEARELASTVKEQASSLLSDTTSVLSEQAGSQQHRLAGGLRSLSEELDSMASGSQQSGIATSFASEASERTQALASWLEDNEPGAVLEQVRSFARRKPGTFVLIAAGVGLLAGRFARGLTADEDQDAGQVSATTSSGVASRGGFEAAGSPGAVTGYPGEDLGVGEVPGYPRDGVGSTPGSGYPGEPLGVAPGSGNPSDEPGTGSLAGGGRP